MKYVASLSFGKDSLAMVLLLIEKNYPLDDVIYYDSGVEFSCMQTLADRFQALCDEKGINFHVLHPKTDFLWNMCSREITKRDGTKQTGYGPCGGPCRWGTALKLESISEFYKNFFSPTETIVEYVGIAADEKQRMNRERQKNKVKLYPLIEWGLTEAQCLNYCHANGWHWYVDGIDLYDSGCLKRVSCWCCGNKNLQELKFIYHKMPSVWNDLKELQAKVDRPLHAGKSIFELEERFKNEDAQISIFDLF